MWPENSRPLENGRNAQNKAINIFVGNSVSMWPFLEAANIERAGMKTYVLTTFLKWRPLADKGSRHHTQDTAHKLASQTVEHTQGEQTLDTIIQRVK